LSLLSNTFANEGVRPELEEPPGKILVVTSCTKDKMIPSLGPNLHQLMPDQLWDEQDDDRPTRNFGVLDEYRVPASQLYRGRQHLQLMKGVELLRQTFGHTVVDVKIISAGFGLVSEDQPLPPYNATFADLSASKILTISQRLRIPQKINQLMSDSYDCAFFLLGDRYLLSIGLPFSQKPNFPCLFLAGPSSHKRVPRRVPYYFVRVGQDDSVSFSYNLVGLKGQLFKLFVDQIVGSPYLMPSTMLKKEIGARERFSEFLKTPTPEQFLSTVNSFRQSERVSKAQSKIKAAQSSLFTNLKGHDFKRAKNYGRPMRYFIPDWDDLVDPGYNFVSETGAKGKLKYHDEVYAHQIYKEPNYDGLLFSKSTVEDGAIKTKLVRDMGIHAFARFEKPIMGDCGAFSYITHQSPPYQTREILDYYQNLGFDYGVSIDHLIIPAFYPVKEYRYNLTRENAREFIELHRAGGYTFTPIGVAQGWSPETYKQAVAELLDLGYQYVALGGLARAKTEEIYAILEAITPILSQDTDLHLFGVARDREEREMLHFRQLGVTSFDSASYLRRAWMSATTNYFTEDGGRYAAIRISPVYPSSPRVRSLLADGVASFEQLQKLERQALTAVREYDRGSLDLETTLETLLEIDKLEQYNYDQHKLLYRRVLEDQPWKKCSCEVCQALGIEVIIFRGNDRNRRRGFHNTHVFYKRFRKLIGLGYFYSE
jgi:Queuine tRNA-ribosyltransferase